MQKYHIIKTSGKPSWHFGKEGRNTAIRVMVSRLKLIIYARRWLEAREHDGVKRELYIHKADGMVDWTEQFPAPSLTNAMQTSINNRFATLPPDHGMQVIPPTPDFPVVGLVQSWDQGDRCEEVAGLGNRTWRVQDLLLAVKDQPVFDIPLAFLDLSAHCFKTEGGLIDFATHMRKCMDCDLDAHPIIFDQWGRILDGRHRIVKALVEGRTTLKGVKVPDGTYPTYHSTL